MYCRLFKFPSSVGIVPVSWLLSNSLFFFVVVVLNNFLIEKIQINYYLQSI